MPKIDLDEQEARFFENHIIVANHNVTLVYAICCLAPLLILICCEIGWYSNYSVTLARVVFGWSLALNIVFRFILLPRVKPNVFKYLIAFFIQTVLFPFMIDANFNITISVFIMPLLTLMYFDPRFTFFSCCMAVIFSLVGLVMRAEQAIAMYHLDDTPLHYILAVGSGALIEYFVVTLTLCITAVQARKFMVSVVHRNVELATVQSQIIFRVADIIEERDEATGFHVKRTSKIVSLLTEKLLASGYYGNKLTLEDARYMELAAPLHDVGKLKVPDAILTKPGKLTSEEREIIEAHTIEGGKLVDIIFKGIESQHYIEIARQMALCHHERWDGTGYPSRVAGDDIPVVARIMAVADVFDALASSRPYKKAFSVDKSLQIIEELRGKHFEPMLVDLMHSLRPILTNMYEGDEESIENALA